MTFKKLTFRDDGKPVYVNMSLVTDMSRNNDYTSMYALYNGGEVINEIQVMETPEEILNNK